MIAEMEAGGEVRERARKRERWGFWEGEEVNNAGEIFLGVNHVSSLVFLTSLLQLGLH